jgi:biotin carboxyl carrier protein
MEQKEYVELRSEDVQEILGAPPGWLVRWGTSVVLFAFAMLLSVAGLMEYPDVTKAKIEITTAVPPVDVVARADGYLDRLFVVEKEKVAQNQLLGVLKSTAKYRHVLRLDSVVSRWQRLPLDSFRVLRPLRSLEIGDIQPDYLAFIQSLETFQFGKDNRSVTAQSNLSAINQQIYSLRQSITFDKKVLTRIKEQLVTAEELLRAQEGLFKEGIVTKTDYAKERTKVAELENQRDLLDEGILRKEREIIDLQKNQTQITSSQQETTTTTTTTLLNSLNALRGNIDRWKQSYLLFAPINGTVTQNKFYSEQQFVKAGDQVLTIVPQQTGNKEIVIGRLDLPINGSGKVKEKQRVVIKLDNYPYTDYGTVGGVVVSKSLVAKDGKYAIIVTLPDGLKTNFRDQRIDFTGEQLYGTAEIITDRKTFLQRIADQVFARR